MTLSMIPDGAFKRPPRPVCIRALREFAYDDDGETWTYRAYRAMDAAFRAAMVNSGVKESHS